MDPEIHSPTKQSFNGLVYYKSGQYYVNNLVAWDKSEKPGAALHRAVWIYHNGPIPPKYHIHHIDENRDNNKPSNLACLSAADHATLHGRQRLPKGTRPNDACLAAAAQWHKSAEGKKFHRQIGALAWVGKEKKVFTCEQCGQKYLAYFSRAKINFCDQSCRRRYNAGLVGPAAYRSRKERLLSNGS